MNELQAKLARRRNLNGEGDPKAVAAASSPEPVRSTSSEQATKPAAVGKSPKTESSSIAVSSGSASSELQKKLARRRNLNGEIIQDAQDSQQCPQEETKKESSHQTDHSQIPEAQRNSVEHVTNQVESVHIENHVELPSHTHQDHENNADQNLAEVERVVVTTIPVPISEITEIVEVAEPVLADVEPKNETNDAIEQNLIENSVHHQVSEPEPEPEAEVEAEQEPEVAPQQIPQIPEQLHEAENPENHQAESVVDHKPEVVEHVAATTERASLDAPPRESITSVDSSPRTSSPLPRERQSSHETTHSKSNASQPVSIAVSSSSASSELQQKLSRRRSLNGEDGKSSAAAPVATSAAPVEPPSSPKPVVTAAPVSSAAPSVAPINAPAPIDPHTTLKEKKSFLLADDDEELDLPFLTSKGKGSSTTQKPKISNAIWDDDTVLSNLAEDEEGDPLNLTQQSKEEVTKKLFKPREQPKPATPPPVVPSSPTKASSSTTTTTAVPEEENLDDLNLDDMALPDLKALKKQENDKAARLNWYPGKYIRERRLPWKSPTAKKMGQQQVMDQFNEFVSGLNERKTSVDGGAVAVLSQEKSLLEELEFTPLSDDTTADDDFLPPPPEIPSSSSLAPKAKEPQNAKLTEFLAQSDKLMQELDQDDLDLPVNRSPSKQSLQSLDVLQQSIEPSERPNLQRMSSTRTRKARLYQTDDGDEDYEGGGLFDDSGNQFTPSAKNTLNNNSPKPVLLLDESSESAKSSAANVDFADKALESLLGSGHNSVPKYNPLQNVSEQALIRSHLNASSRRTTTTLVQGGAQNLKSVMNKGLVTENASESSDEEECDDNEREPNTQKANKHKSKSLFRDSIHADDEGISMETKQIKKGVAVPELEITYDEFIEKFRRCRDLTEITKRFILSIVGPNGDGSQPTKSQKIDYKFYGIESIDERCRLFFDEMQNKLSKQQIFEGGEEWIISVRDCLERFVMQKIADLAFPCVEKEFREEDQNLLRRMKVLSFLTPEALDIKPELFNEPMLSLAGDELRKINSFKTPADKIECVIKCVTIIFRSLSLARVKQEAVETNKDRSNPQLAGADDFLPLFIWVVLRCNIPALITNCEYIQLYLNPARLMSKSGYCLINLRSAIEFVNYLDPTSINIDVDFFQQQLAEAEKKLAASE